MSTELKSNSRDSPELSSPISSGSGGGGGDIFINNHHGLGSKLHLNTLTSKAADPPHFSSLIGKTLPLDKAHQLVVEEVIAEGGFGVIFLVKNTKNDKAKLALKRVVVNNERDYANVIGEVAIMATLSQKTPHILASLSHLVVSYGSQTHEVQNLMPLCKQNLLQVASSRMQKSTTFTETEILQILKCTCLALLELHTSTQPIIHRDIKMENILLLDDNYVLSDFGSATTRIWDPNTDSVTAITEDLDKHTTLQYRSPEMVDLWGQRGPISVASDIWALGATAFKLMSFKDAFETVLAIQNRNLTWGSVKSKYSEQLVTLVEVLLAENQATRPPVDEVIRICTGGLCGDWTHLSACFQRITRDIRAREEQSKKQTSSNNNNANVVMETTVTPRQRPKRTAAAGVPGVVAAGGGGGNSTGGVAAAATSAPGGGLPATLPLLSAPPKSPKPLSPSPGIADGSSAARFFSPAPATLQQQQPSTISPTPPQHITTTTATTSATGSKTATPSPTPSSSSASSALPQSQPPTNNITNTTTTSVSNTSLSSAAAASSSSSQQATTPVAPVPPPSSWNPFDEDYTAPPAAPPPPPHQSSAAAPQFCDSDQQQPDIDDDPFARAPFDYFKYQPIPVTVGGGEFVTSTTVRGGGLASSSSSSQQFYTQPFDYSSPQQQPFYYAPNNPFLNYTPNHDDDHDDDDDDNDDDEDDECGGGGDDSGDHVANNGVSGSSSRLDGMTGIAYHNNAATRQQQHSIILNNVEFVSQRVNNINNSGISNSSSTNNSIPSNNVVMAAVGRGVTNLSFDDEYLMGTTAAAGAAAAASPTERATNNNNAAAAAAAAATGVSRGMMMMMRRE